MVKLAGMMRPHIAVLDDELRDAHEAGQERYKKQPCKRRRKWSALTTRLIASSQMRNRTSFLTANHPAVGFAAQKIETMDNMQKSARGSFTGRKRTRGRRLQEVNHIEDSGARQEGLRSGKRDLKRQNKESKEDSGPS